MDLNMMQFQSASQMAGLSVKTTQLKDLSERFRSRENREELHKTAKQFESVFIKQLLMEMDKTVDRTDSLLGGGAGEDTFREMMYDKVAESIANRPGGSGFGLAEQVYKQLEAKLPKAESINGVPWNPLPKNKKKKTR